MKKELIALNLMVLISLNAMDEMNSDHLRPLAPTREPTRISSPRVPKPSSQICSPSEMGESSSCDCSCSLSPFYNLECALGISIDAEFLYWYANETNLSYAVKVTRQPEASGSSTFFLGSTTYEYLKTNWRPGFRVGLGLNFDCDGWDSHVTWTWMKNQRSDSVQVPEFLSTLLQDPQTVYLISPWINQAFQQGGAALYDIISATWKLSFNQIDWDIGRKYWVSRCFTLRPFAGVRGGWWKTHFNNYTYRTTETGSEVTGIVRGSDLFTNKVWGVGIFGGLEPAWYFCSNFALYGSIDAAILWGNFEAKKNETILVQDPQTMVIRTNYINASKGSFYQASPMLDLAIGFRWEETWCCNRFLTRIDLGWEHHTIFDQNHRMKTYDNFQFENNQISGFRTYDEVTGNLSMGGLVIRLNMDF